MCLPTTLCRRASVSPLARPGVLLIAHAPLAQAFVCVAEHVLGRVDRPLAALDLAADDSREHALLAAQSLAAGMGCGDLLILVDIHGGPSPCVVAQRLCEIWGPRARLVGGLNVAMLLTALECSDGEVGRLAEEVAEAARIGVCNGGLS
ncbi:MAG: PTS system fructose IIA component [Candidatus Accumulibacter vicinus]|uniref:PTS system fructose IIA component n=1 Tax=Candidatus Accumulibacter vicinus TaxID=2954382 RepID=A0A084Y4J0_9PROT|nr:MAG: PTS system fructose IIA component [Candidatus Accumulibacter vicinus]